MELGEKINSDLMKIAVASYYRYDLQYKYTCTEFEYMDVCASNGTNLIEVEIKISKSDLKNEKKHKAKKHKQYKEVKKGYLIPNKYYFCITKEMYEEEECVKFIEDLNPKYGIMVLGEVGQIFIKKGAFFLHKGKLQGRDKEKIVARMSSENIILRRNLFSAQKKLDLYKTDKKDKKNGEEI